MLPELTDAIQMGIASATTDGWTCDINSCHYITLTFHYVHDDGEKWSLKWRVLYTSKFEPDSETIEWLNYELKTQCAAHGLDPCLLEKVHFVSDGAANLIGSLGEYSRSYCMDHCLNISLQTAFDAHLIRMDLYGDKGGAVVESIHKAVDHLLRSKEKCHKWCSERLKRGPNVRTNQKRFASCIPMLRSALKHYGKVSSAFHFLK
jgi:hypothetical protein